MILTLLPILTFWVTAFGVHSLGLDSQANIHNDRNLVSFRETLVRMAQIDALHILTTLPLEWAWLLPEDQVMGFRWSYLLGGILLMDTLQYCTHRTFHAFPVLYRNIHVTHHDMRHNWSFGAFYNSWPDVLVTGALMGLVFVRVFRFTFVEFQIVSCISIFWTVLDHTAYFDKAWWQGRENFHHIHHSVRTDCNFQQPFFTFWDRMLGTDYESVIARKSASSPPAVAFGS